MLGDDSLSPYNAASVSLIRLLKEEQSKSSILEARLLQDLKPVFIANLMYVLYQSTQNRIWLDKLFEFTETNARYPDVWGVFAQGTWSGGEEIEIMKFIVRTASKLRLGHDAIGRAFHIFQLPKNRPEKAKSEFLTAEKVEFIRLGRNLALDIRAYPVPKLYGILAAAFFAPEAYPVLASTILASENESEAAKDALREHIRDVRSGIFEVQYSHLKQTLQRLDFPTDLPQGAARWKKTKLAQKWVALVLENNLEELVRQQSGVK
jgi:hypothetical protein